MGISSKYLNKTVVNKTPANKTVPDKSSRTFVVAVLLIASIAPVVAAFINACVSDWVPVDDFAIINMRVRQVWSSHTPLTGLYSRPGWNHAGPMMFWALSPFSVLSGGSSRWVLIGGVVIAAGFISTALFLAFRQTRSLFVFTVLLWLLSLRALPIESLTRYWNPWMPLPALLLLLVLALRTASGKPRDLIGLVVVGSFAVQTHIGTALIVVTISLFAFGCVAFDACRERALPAGFRSIAAWVASLSALLWAAPVIGAVRGDQGNLGAVFKYFLAGSHPSVGIANALKIMANEFSPPFPWLGAGYRIEFLSGHALLSPVVWLLLPIGALFLGGFLAYKQVPGVDRRRGDLRAVLLATLLLFASVSAISAADEPRAYTFAWRAIVAVFILLAAVQPLARRAVAFQSFMGLRVPARSAFLFAIIILSCSLTFEAYDFERRGDSAGGIGTVFAPELANFERSFNWRALDNGERVLIVWGSVSARHQGLAAGLVNALALRGRSVGVPSGAARVWGTHWVLRASNADEVWTVTENGSLTPGLLAQPNAKLVWSSTPLNSRDEARLAGLQARLTSQLKLLGKPEYASWLDSEIGAVVLARDIPELLRSDTSELSRLLAKAGGQCRCAIVKIPGGKGYVAEG